MRIIRLQAEGFKRLVAIDITPAGDLVEVRGNNGNGKSSVLDAIFCALAGASVAPVKPVRDGEEFAIIRVDLGELVVTRIFTDEGTTRLKVTNADGTATFDKGQTMLDELLGHIAFDPLEFARLKPDEQADQLSQLVNLEIDLAKLSADDRADYANRRDVNRDAKAIKVRLDAIPKLDKPETLPDRSSLVDQLEEAANKNAARQRQIDFRDSKNRELDAMEQDIERLRADIARIQERIAEGETIVSEGRRLLEAAEPVPDPIDVAELRLQIDAADKAHAIIAQIRNREALEAEFNQLEAQSTELTERMNKRARSVGDALAAAKMPVAGLALVTDESGKLGVEFDGIPFSQSSSADQLRVSTAIAMSANPKLRVIRIKDGSLLDKNSLAVLREMATENDFQIWGEFVGDEGAGIIMESGKVRGAPEPEPLDKPRRRKSASEESPVKEELTVNNSAVAVVDEPFDPETGELKNAPSNEAPQINKPAEAAPTMLENMGAPEAAPRRRRVMSEFITKPQTGGN